MSTAMRRDYVQKIFERQCEIGLENLQKIHAVVGEKVQAVFVTGTDFGMQTGPFISPKSYRQLFQPFHKEINGWIHRNTTWKTFIHSCGSVVNLIPDFLDAGFDILNPVQTSAAGMDPAELKTRFGDRLVFWGGGVDTQQTLPFGSAAEVRAQVRERMQIFGPGGGFVFNTIHNLQAQTPLDNLLALYDAVKEYRNLAND
jgi:uroporphyrinogen-III decarboxylase